MYEDNEDVWGVEIYVAVLILISALDGGEWSDSRPGPFYLRGKSLRYPLDRRLQSRDGGLDVVEETKVLASAGN
jgi:hypothetical protein